jgi:hypothetical protein
VAELEELALDPLVPPVRFWVASRPMSAAPTALIRALVMSALRMVTASITTPRIMV